MTTAAPLIGAAGALGLGTSAAVQGQPWHILAGTSGFVERLEPVA